MTAPAEETALLTWYRAVRGYLQQRHVPQELEEDLAQEMTLCILEDPGLRWGLQWPYLRARTRLGLRIRVQQQGQRQWHMPEVLHQQLLRHVRRPSGRRWQEAQRALEQAIDLKTVLACLPSVQQRGLWQVLFAGWSLRDVAQAEGVTAAAISLRLHTLGRRYGSTHERNRG